MPRGGAETEERGKVPHDQLSSVGARAQMDRILGDLATVERNVGQVLSAYAKQFCLAFLGREHKNEVVGRGAVPLCECLCALRRSRDVAAVA